MRDVVPAIIPESMTGLETALLSVSPFTHAVQIDIVDGIFVPFTSWPYVQNGDMKDFQEVIEGFTVEVDLMIMHPELTLQRWYEAGVKRIIVHLESVKDLDAIFSHYDTHEYALGFSIQNDTPLEMIKKHIDRIDFVQLMGIASIGSQGQPFDERVLERIHTLKSQFPDLPVSIDGSVNDHTLPKLRAAGADRFVAGSAILHADNPKEAFESLVRIANPG